MLCVAFCLSKTIHNLHYEQVGKEVRCIEEELPFEIPNSWKWDRWGNISFKIQYGYNAPAKNQGKIKMVRISDIQNNTVNWPRVPFCDISDNDVEDYLLHNNDILFARTGGTVGKSFLVNSIKENAIFAGYLIRTVYDFNNLNSNYLKYFMETGLYWNQLKEGTIATAQPNCNGQTLSSMFIPIPPIKEQCRIVDKIKKLEPLIDKYKQAEEQLNDLNSNIKEQLKKSILQYAIEGKLVPQDPNDEPASILLERIHKEKEKLIAEGKIKKDKFESVIYRRDNSYYEKQSIIENCINNELPFEIPNSWEWIRLGSLTYNHGQKEPNCNFCYIDIGSVNNEKQMLNKNETVLSADKAPSRARKIVKFGDILYSTVRPYLHNMCIINRSFSFEPIASTGFAVLTCHSNYLNGFLFMYMMSPIFDEYANSNENSKGVAYPAINDSRLSMALVPVPPASEQQKFIDNYKRITHILS